MQYYTEYCEIAEILHTSLLCCRCLRYQILMSTTRTHCVCNNVFMIRSIVINKIVFYDLNMI